LTNALGAAPAVSIDTLNVEEPGKSRKAWKYKREPEEPLAEQQQAQDADNENGLQEDQQKYRI
jgi:hypothetical protein